MTTPASGAAEPVPSRQLELTEHERERLRVARRWAVFLSRTGAVGFGLLLLLLLDLRVGNPHGLRKAANAQLPTVIASGVLFVVAGLGAIALLWSYGRNVAAFFVRGDAALTRAFRRIRHFLILWTVAAALTALFEFLSVWQRF